MTDETTTLDPAAEEPQEPAEETKDKLSQTVDISDVGPCKKHFKVTIERGDIEKLFDDKYAELVHDSAVPGFRPGKAPRAIVVRKYRKDVERQVRSELLMASLEQLGEDHEVAPLSPPNINPEKLDIPEDGPFVYEFDVEVRPEFDLPNYKGLKLKRPTHTFSEEEVEKEEKRILSRYGQLVPKPEGNAEIGDFIIVDMETRYGDNVIGSAKETAIRIDERVAFKDGVSPKFAEQTVGASAGDTRTVDIEMTEAVAVDELKGQTVQSTLVVNDVKKLRLPELTREFLQEFGVQTPEQLREKVQLSLERQLKYRQNQSIREQILEHISAAATWELPQDLLMRQASRAFSRRVMEMREAGISDEEINARRRVLERDILNSTAVTLKEHFVLQKIAEEEKIEASDDDVQNEIESMAAIYNESARRLRTQLEREDQLETLAIHIIERRVVDMIIENAEMEEVPLELEKGIASVEQQAVEGELKDPTAAPPDESDEEESAS